MDSDVVKSKFLGSLVGSSVGDALGAGFEGWYRTEIEEIERMADTREALVYTDDTHMMIGIAESLVESKGFNGEHMAYTFMKNFEREPWRGYGPGPPRLFRLMRAGEAWDRVAELLYHGGSYGNGSAMRIAPIGAFYYDDLFELEKAAHQSSRITHSHELGKEGAALQASAVALAVRMDPAGVFKPRDVVAELGRCIRHDVYRQKLEKIAVLLAGATKGDVIAGLGNGIEAFNSVPTALYSFLSHPFSFNEAVLYAISLGGDTDTIGAMTGAISGAYLGIDSIPEKWRTKLENRPYIEELAEQLWQIQLQRRNGNRH